MFNQKNYKDALEAYLKFKADFSASPDAAKAIQSSLYPIAICCVQQGRFTEAVPAITEALATNPPLSAQQTQELTFWLGIANLQSEDYAAARAALEKFIALFPAGAEKNPFLLRSNPAAARVPEARMLIGTSSEGSRVLTHFLAEFPQFHSYELLMLTRTSAFRPRTFLRVLVSP